MTKEIQKVTRGSRPKRAPIGQRGRLTVTTKQADREYRFVNDKDGRVEMFQQNGWTIEKAEDHVVGDRRVDVSSVSGSAARYGVGLGDHAVLMSIDKEWYAEDQAEKQKLVDNTEQTIKQEVSRTHKGTFEVSRGN